jgi:drug/metabolite transporter (DMT)-like permease
VGDTIKIGHRGTRFLAYAAVFILWGGSFLAVREIVLVAPPFLAAAFRFSVAGVALLLWGLISGAVRPSRREVGSTAVLGLAMFAVNYACLFWAEQRVSSGYAAIISSTVPVWVFAGEWLWLRSIRPNGMALTGMGLGVSGVALLVLPESSGEWTPGAVALLTGALCWAGGTLWSRRLPMPKSRHVSAGLQMAFGGGFLCVLSAAVGDFSRLPAIAAVWTPRLTFDMVYLIAAASIAAFLAFVWLIEHEPASRVTSHAYVNPLIAVLLGAVVAGERLALVQIAGAALVLLGVVFTLRARSG